MLDGGLTDDVQPEHEAAAARSGRPAPAVVKTEAALASLLTATELSVVRSKAYHASENLATAYGY